MSADYNSYEIEVKVTGPDDVQHSITSSIAAEIMPTPGVAAEVFSDIFNRSKNAMIKKLVEAK